MYSLHQHAYYCWLESYKCICALVCRLQLDISYYVVIFSINMWKKKSLKVAVAMEKEKMEALQWLGNGKTVQKVEEECRC
jgi:hypothetical protein